MNDFWDRLGISASLLCVVHCVATPFLILLSPLVGSYLSQPLFHIVIVAVVFPVAVWALWMGYRIHRFKRMLWLGIMGLILIIFAMTLGREDTRIEMLFMISAGVFLSAAHYLNLRACRQCGHGHRHHH
jgi:uncharacterized membrane protein YvlD (DUF360 family)